MLAGLGAWGKVVKGLASLLGSAEAGVAILYLCVCWV